MVWHNDTVTKESVNLIRLVCMSLFYMFILNKSVLAKDIILGYIGKRLAMEARMILN